MCIWGGVVTYSACINENEIVVAAHWSGFNTGRKTTKLALEYCHSGHNES